MIVITTKLRYSSYILRETIFNLVVICWWILKYLKLKQNLVCLANVGWMLEYHIWLNSWDFRMPLSKHPVNMLILNRQMRANVLKVLCRFHLSWTGWHCFLTWQTLVIVFVTYVFLVWEGIATFFFFLLYRNQRNFSLR